MEREPAQFLAKNHPKQLKEIETYLADRDPILKELFLNNELQWPRLKSTAFECVVHAIIAQQISAKSADTIWKKFIESCKITPRALLNQKFTTYQSLGIPKFRAKYIKNFCRYCLNNDIEAINPSNYAEFKTSLLQVAGIGPWTIEMLAIFHLNHLNIFPLGDLGLRRVLSDYYNHGEKLSVAEIKKIQAKWEPFKTVATLYLWRSSVAWVEY